MILTFLFGGVLPNSYFFNRKRLTSYQICWPSLAYFWAISYKFCAIMGFINLLWAILATFYGDLRKKMTEKMTFYGKLHVRKGRGVSPDRDFMEFLP